MNQAPLVILQDDDNDAISIFFNTTTNIFLLQL